jgi:hypothetical protein
VSRFWFTYRQDGRFAGVVVIDASSPRSARKRAAAKAGRKARFASSTELLVDLAKLVPDTAISRMLTRDEAASLIGRIERGILKRPAAASVRRAVKRKRASS